MKYATLILLCFIPYFLCDGVRVAINEKFITAMLQSFLPELKQMADGTDLDDSGCLDKLHFKIPNFSLDKIGISFTNTGLLNIKINGLSPELSGRATKKILFVKVRKSFTVTLKNFRFDGNFKVGTKYVDGVRVPDLTFSGDPSINFTAKLDLGHSILWKLVSGILSTIANIVKKFVMPAIRRLLRNLLEKVVKKLPRDISIPINGINYKLDVTMSESGINLRNKFLEINSKARLYNANIKETKDKYFPNVYFPYITTMGNQLQLYISEYSISSAIYTLLKSNYQEIKTTIDTSKISQITQGIINPNEKINLMFKGNPDKITLGITEESLNVNVPGTLLLKTTNNQDLLSVNIKLALKAKVGIQTGEHIYGNVMDLVIDVDKLNFSKKSVDISIITKIVKELKSTILPLLNAFIATKMKIKFPNVMGIRFTQLSVEHKAHYLQINYNLVRN